MLRNRSPQRAARIDGRDMASQRGFGLMELLIGVGLTLVILARRWWR
ncbi:MAG: hypothetical protein ABGY72_02075 [bacterium]